MPSTHSKNTASKTLLLRLRYNHLLVRYDCPAQVIRECQHECLYAYLFDLDAKAFEIVGPAGATLREHGAVLSERDSPSLWSSTPVGDDLIPTLSLDMKAPEGTRLAYPSFSASLDVIEELASRAAQAFLRASSSRAMIAATPDHSNSSGTTGQIIHTHLERALAQFQSVIDADALAQELYDTCSPGRAGKPRACSI